MDLCSEPALSTEVTPLSLAAGLLLGDTGQGIEVGDVPTFTFSYCCQTNAFEIYAELKRPTVYRMTFTSAVSMYACTALYLVASISGVAEFGVHSDSNVLKSYTDITSKWYVIAAMIGITFTLNMAFPICIFPMRDAILASMGHEDVFNAPAKHRVPVALGLAVLSLLSLAQPLRSALVARARGRDAAA